MSIFIRQAIDTDVELTLDKTPRIFFVDIWVAAEVGTVAEAPCDPCVYALIGSGYAGRGSNLYN